MKFKRKITEENGDLFTMQDWIKEVQLGTLVDKDGFGSYSDGLYVYVNTEIYPSDLNKNLIDSSWSHVMWYNR
jgi:hypothetical protein